MIAQKLHIQTEEIKRINNKKNQIYFHNYSSQTDLSEKVDQIELLRFLDNACCEKIEYFPEILDLIL